MPPFTHVVEVVGLAIDAAGVAVIVAGLVVAAVRYAHSGHRKTDGYKELRHDLGRGILLGLECLVAADIIRTVAVAPTLANVGVLAIIVLIRTFLSTALQVELEGHFPWQRPEPHRKQGEARA